MPAEAFSNGQSGRNKDSSDSSVHEPSQTQGNADNFPAEDVINVEEVESDPSVETVGRNEGNYEGDDEFEAGKDGSIE